jgi:hypothetical protein
MPLADGQAGTITLTDAQKNERAGAQVKAACARIIQAAAQVVAQANSAVSNAPGDKAAVMATLGADEAEAAAILADLVTLHNGHKKTGADDISF